MISNYQKRKQVIMKKGLLIILLPALLLTSCKGKQISEEEAEPIMNAIHERLEEPCKNIEISLKSSGVSVVDGKSVRQDVVYHLVQNDKDEIKFEMKGSADGQKVDTSFVRAKNATYTEVTYVKQLDSETNEYNEYTYVAKNNPSYDSSSLYVVIFALVPALMFSAFSDPTNLSTGNQTLTGGGITTEKNVKYYSRNDKNLTIEITQVAQGHKRNEGTEGVVDMTGTITYDNLFLNKVVIKGKTNYDNPVNMDMGVKVSETTNKISLPSGWEKHIK